LRLTSPLNLPAPGRRQCVYGALCGLAHTCVFAKQSLEPIICDPSKRPARSRLPQRASLLPKLRDHYAEFLDHVSLVHLRLLALPTCVGLRYGRLQHSRTELFLPADSTRLGIGLPRFLVLQSRLPYTVERPIHKAARASFLGPSVVANTLQAGPEY
jgi:hypothetical protein